ncbi:hypothetical protein FocTR4_00007205, partial [Fusarium oxysporum f. sp. cubense]
AGLDLVSTYLLESRRIPRQREREREIDCRATSAVDSPGQARYATPSSQQQAMCSSGSAQSAALHFHHSKKYG